MQRFYDFLLKISVLPLLFFVTIGSAQDKAFLDPTQPLNTRVNDLISQLTLEEKVSQMMNNSPAIPRLDIPAYNWWSEALHGVARSGSATIFPQAIGMAATFDQELIYKEASTISDEARAMFNSAVKQGYRQQYGGLTFWTPNINIFRDPRWGRGQETYGEDPFLTSLLGSSFVRGMQGNNPNYLKVAACAKHFAVHSGPEKLRHEFDAEISAKDLRETYLPAFKALVDAHVEAVMCAYNSVDGQPCCTNKMLLQDILRKEWGFKGHVLSDCGAIYDVYNGHHAVPTAAEASAIAVKDGVSLNCGSSYASLVDAVHQSLITENQIDSALAVLLRTRFRLGLFDPPGRDPYDSIGPEVINSASHRQLARRAAQEAIVMLKNDGVLPLKNDLSTYFITGPNASSVDALIGNYYGVNPEVSTILEGVAGAIAPGSQLQYRPGILLDRENTNPADWTSGTAKTSDVTFVVLGITGVIEGEEGESIASPTSGDRLDYDLPKNQIEFLRKLRDNNKKPIIAIITGGSPMNLAEVQELSDAVLLVWYPGEEGGNGVADVLFGKTSPSGRLPITFPKSFDQLPPYEDYAMKGRTYRYMTAEPLYPFGFGLSYTRFDYSQIKLTAAKIKKDQSTDVAVTVTNAGSMAGDEVVQLYITDDQASVTVPLYSLRGVKRIHLDAGQSQVVKFTITPDMLMLVNNDGKSVLEPGTFTIAIGGSLPSQRSLDLGASPPQKIILTVK